MVWVWIIKLWGFSLRVMWCGVVEVEVEDEDEEIVRYVCAGLWMGGEEGEMQEREGRARNEMEIVGGNGRFCLNLDFGRLRT